MYHFLFHHHKSQESVDEMINHAKKLLINVDIEQKTHFLRLLNLRVIEFQTELNKASLDSYDKELILTQYEKFAKTLLICMEYPVRASSAIYYYHNRIYYPVAIQDKMKPEPIVQKIAITTVSICIALLIGSIPSFIFNPLIGALMVSLAVTLLLPSSFCLLVPDSPDTTKKKAQEKRIFEEGAKLIDPDVILEEFDENYYIPTAKM